MTAVQNSQDQPLGISRPLLRWYDVNARELPWRVGPAARKSGTTPDPYHVWLSEIMLQQTTVATVTPRYQQFLRLWPDLSTLAAAPQEAVLAEWAGLGYYARARNLHKCAGVLEYEYNGIFPHTVKELQKLPGIGPYTASAIAAIAFDEPAPVMDGNIERVMARLYAVDTPLPQAKSRLYAHVTTETPGKRAGDHAQALMDLGATICTPRNPACSICPLSAVCQGYGAGNAAELPKKARKKKKPTRYGTAFVIRRKQDGRVLLVRRPAIGLLGGMLATPTTEWQEDASRTVNPPLKAGWKKSEHKVLHTFTHFHLQMDVWEAEVGNNNAGVPEGEWVTNPLAAGLPTVFRKVFSALSG